MSQLKPASKALKFFSLIIDSNKWTQESALELLGVKEPLIFNPEYNPSTDYYSKEMGQDLQRFIVVDVGPVDREEIVTIKQWATDIENEHSMAGKRSINIDPGLICQENLLLSTGKPYSHRVYLRDGVFMELVYQFQKNTYIPTDWTYPDYKHQEKIEFFMHSRGILAASLGQ